jgi:hypothetical protein
MIRMNFCRPCSIADGVPVVMDKESWQRGLFAPLVVHNVSGVVLTVRATILHQYGRPFFWVLTCNVNLLLMNCTESWASGSSKSVPCQWTCGNYFLMRKSSTKSGGERDHMPLKKPLISNWVVGSRAHAPEMVLISS